MEKCGTNKKGYDLAGVQQLVVQYGAKAVINARSCPRICPLCIDLAAYLAEDLLWYLLEIGANPNGEDNRRYPGTPLKEASRANNSHNVEILLHFNADASDQGSMALYHAADNAEIARLLLQNGAKPNDRTQAGRYAYLPTPFLYAVGWGKLNNIREQAKWMETIPSLSELFIQLGVSENRKYTDELLAALKAGGEERLAHLGKVVRERD